MYYVFLLFLPTIVTGRKTGPSYLQYTYYYDTKFSILVTAKETNLVNKIALLERLVREYTNIKDVGTAGQLTFNRLPLTEFAVKETFQDECQCFTSNNYKTTYYISHINKTEPKWFGSGTTYYVRLSCYITGYPQIRCTAAYNDPRKRETVVYFTFVFFAFILMIFICGIVSQKRERKLARQSLEPAISLIPVEPKTQKLDTNKYSKPRAVIENEYTLS